MVPSVQKEFMCAEMHYQVSCQNIINVVLHESDVPYGAPMYFYLVPD